MFFLVFLVMFNIKKGSIVAYSPNWYFSIYTNLRTSILANYNNKSFSKNWKTLFLNRYQFTSITSRSTTYFLFGFWLFFFFYGETLLLVLFNYSTLTDTIPSSSFFLIKQHVVFLLITSSTKLLSCINFYIFFFNFNSFCIHINFTVRL